MANYRVQQQFTIWREVDVDADSLPEAMEKAAEKFMVGDFQDSDEPPFETDAYWYEADNGDIGGLIKLNAADVWVMNDYGNDLDDYPLTPCHNATFISQLCASETCDVIHEYALCEICGQNFNAPTPGCELPNEMEQN